MAFRRKCSDDSVLSKALLMSAMLMTESWATEVSPWPQCVKVVPQDKQHSLMLGFGGLLWFSGHNVTVLQGSYVQSKHAYHD